MDGLDRSVSVAEAMVEAENTSKRSGETHCLNCGTPLTGVYCSHCGQKDIPRRQTIGDLLVNFLGSFTSFESKFFNTFRALLLKPGRIVVDYTAGKRETYYHPARMYVFISFIFFLVLSLIPDEDKVNMTDETGRQLTSEEKRALLDSADVPDRIQFSNGIKTVEQYDSAQAALPADKRDGSVERYISRKMLGLGGEEKTWKSVIEGFTANIPKMIFLLMPVFALLLKLLYIRRDFFYSEHLIFTVFYYDFLYLLGTVGLLLSFSSWLEWIQVVLWLYAFFYLYKSMRKVYGQSRGKTILKFFFLLWSFFFCLLIAFVLNFFVTLMLL